MIKTNLTHKNQDISFKTSVHIAVPCQLKADMSAQFSVISSIPSFDTDEGFNLQGYDTI